MATRFSLLLAVAILAGCSGGGSQGSSATSGDWDSASDSPGVAMKISYLSFQPQTDAKGATTGWKHAWKYMLSQGWMNKRGPSPREPFEKTPWRRDAFVGENIHDIRMSEMIDRLKAAGLEELKDTPLNQLDFEKLKRIELTGDKDAASRTRIITVETENFRRTVASYDNHTPGLVERFRAVEREVIKCVFANTIQVTKDSHSTMPRGK